VAARAGVSKATVTCVLSNRYDIAIPEATRERVRQAARELRYTPSPIARALALGRTNTIAVAFPNLFVPHYVRILQTLERCANASGCHIIASTVRNLGHNSVAPDLSDLVNGANDAFVLVDMSPVHHDAVYEILPDDKPGVSVGICGMERLDSVVVDLYSGAAAAMEHLLESRPKRIAFFGPEREELPQAFSAERHEPRALAYAEAMRLAGLSPEAIVRSLDGRKANMALLTSYIQEHGCPDAIFCFDDEVLLSAHHALRRMGRRIPEDVLLVGCDGNIECEYVDPPASTIVQPVQKMCELSWGLLMDRIQNRDRDRQYISLDTKLEIRESSARP
jgi:LacI family transcriptional regulator